MSMRYLITGANGFIGEHLAEALCNGNNTVVACAQFSTPVLDKLEKNLQLFYPDITNGEQLQHIICQSEPEVIFHLAAQSFPRVSWEKPAYTMEVNLIGSINIFEAIRKQQKPARVIMMGSSAEYLPHPLGVPIKENDALGASNIYGVSKLAADETARLYASRYKLPIIRTRPFFIIGPRKEHDFCSDIAKEIVLVEKGEKAHISVGDLRIVRDFVDVRDAIRALIVLSQKGEYGQVYNVCSGKGYPLRELLDIYKRFATVHVQETVNEKLLRDYDEPVKIGSPEKLFSLGWNIHYKLEDTLLDILNYWRCAI
jgi:GDP-4-dehydro-6-deoxy-D-mannose reductase